MKNEKLLEALGKVEDGFIEEAAPEKEAADMLREAECTVKKGLPGKKRNASYGWRKWVAAACAVLIIGIGITWGLWTRDDNIKSSWPEKEDYAFALTEDMVADLATVDTTVEFSSVGDEELPDWGLTLSVKNVTPTGLTLVCTQKGGNPTGELRCGTDYHLIVLEDGTWKDVPTVIEEYGWNSLAYIIWAGQDTEFEYSWEWLYGKLPAGTYRLTKGFMDLRGSGDYDTARYWVEFEITE